MRAPTNPLGAQHARQSSDRRHRQDHRPGSRRTDCRRTATSRWRYHRHKRRRRPPRQLVIEVPALGLFRSEALSNQQRDWLGSIQLIRPVSLALLTGFVLLVAAAVAAYLTLGEYTR